MMDVGDVSECTPVAEDAVDIANEGLRVAHDDLIQVLVLLLRGVPLAVGLAHQADGQRLAQLQVRS